MTNASKLKFFLALLSLGVAVPCLQAKEKKPHAPTALITTAAELSAKVELTDEQLPKAEAIYAADAEAIKALGESPEADAVAKIHDDTKAKVQELLTPEQNAKLAPSGKKKGKKSKSEEA